jgi:hypothetical protein
MTSTVFLAITTSKNIQIEGVNNLQSRSFPFFEKMESKLREQIED